MEAAEYGLTRGTCFLACRPELDAVAGLLWISWCVLGGADFFVCVCVCVFFVLFFFFERTRPAASTYEAVLPSFPLYQILVMRPCFVFQAKTPLHTGVRTGCNH